jgi:7-carboxy-7-deazaguanine synthase
MSDEAQVELCETFVSIQGESTFAGLRCHFIRLSGCNLRCRYCDTLRAYGPGRVVRVSELVDEAVATDAAMCEITGGEPLLQAGFPELAARLRDATGRPVLVETNGSRDISCIPEGVVAIVDVKTPGSGESARADLANLDRLRAADEVKFVLTDRMDYEWSRALVRERNLTTRCRAVHFSPVWGCLDASLLAGWILEDSLRVRLHIQLHKLLELP